MESVSNFITEFRKLYLKSPQCGSWTRASENCDYGDITTVSKDCYMCFNSGNCRDSHFCEDSRALKDCIDMAYCEECELCYECTDCDGCYSCDFCQDCANCNDIHFCYDLRRCKNCIGCVGLRDKEFCIFNEQLNEEEYRKKKKKLDLDNKNGIEFIEEKVRELSKTIPRMYVHQRDTTKCTGDYIYHSKNCHMCFDTRHTEDSLYITQANLDMGTRDSCDCGPIPTGMDLCYDVSYAHYLFNSKHLYWCGNLKDSQWCINCLEGENLFGCNFLHKKYKKFYFLNKEVSEKEFVELSDKVNRELEAKGIYTLYDLLFKPVEGVNDLPETSHERMKYKIDGRVDIGDDVRERKCVICENDFGIVDKEVEFYKKMDIRLLPVYCPGCRSTQRWNMRNERVMHKRKCDSCKNTLITTFPSDTEYIVYCLDCYWKNIG